MNIYDYYKNIEKMASVIRTKTKKIYKESSDIRDYLEKLVILFGGKVIINKEETKTSYGCLMNKDNSFEIILPFLSSPLHDNFYIAKGLGDFLLFNENGKEKFLPSVRPAMGNLHSNRFATSLLMPKQEFKKALKNIGEDFSLLAKHFSVAENFVKSRYQNLTSTIILENGQKVR